MKKVISMLMVVMILACATVSASAALDTTGADVTPGLALLRSELWEDHSMIDSHTGKKVIMLRVRGEVKNVTNKTASGVIIRYGVYDASGKLIKEITAQTRGLAPGKEWTFATTPYLDEPGLNCYLLSLEGY